MALNRKSKGPKKPRVLKKKHSHVLRKLALAFVIVLLAAALYAKAYPYTHDAQVRRELESTSQRLLETKQQLEQQAIESQAESDEQQKKLKEIQQKLEETERALQAKRAAKKVYAAASSYNPSGNKEQWMSAAGIPASEWWAVDYIVTRESSWNPRAVNPNGGACGLAQALPCSKLGPNWYDPVHALKWQYQYVVSRYGGYPQAVEFWKANHWY